MNEHSHTLVWCERKPAPLAQDLDSNMPRIPSQLVPRLHDSGGALGRSSSTMLDTLGEFPLPPHRESSQDSEVYNATDADLVTDSASAPDLVNVELGELERVSRLSTGAPSRGSRGALLTSPVFEVAGHDDSRDMVISAARSLDTDEEFAAYNSMGFPVSVQPKPLMPVFWPYQTVGRVAFTWWNAKGDKQTNWGSGVLVGPRHVLTASHVVPTTGIVGSPIYWPDAILGQVTFTPGYWNGQKWVVKTIAGKNAFLVERC